ncbi:MAG: 30S ribosome-binding factor RbfA [Tissierellia bacterium]|jgi:ribosome-binding factor A|nr:30S ribosome-binding factor RbfA [Tissierellia bacterium]MDD3226072.1 30S ribosome-binding factor RbfA [Tissierellia bacterium]MDD3751476.1 30S ribosome-binding factor RbfA [Tissierellia bacterium]MDD4045704.1 30S ribosome-binding factor RbfA [Tissierellia bacterium]MDD4677647.1 30S ribosome-binding factor RbfA [Tissierellia bacterium]
MANRRNNRLSGEVKRAISEIIRFDVKDPRISELMSITDVHVTEDLKFAKIYVSDYNDIESTLIALNSAKGFIRKEIGKKVKMRIIPELIFIKDDSIAKGMHMSSLIDKIIEEDKIRKVNEDNAEE